jgi:hypothetical protein
MKQSPGDSGVALVEAQAELEVYFDAEAKLSEKEIGEREDHWGEATFREAIREERW